MTDKSRLIGTSERRIGALVSAGLIAALPMAFGQSTSNDADGEIFTLSPFTVDASQDQGYRASQTLAGGRISTEIKDTGTSIEVVTKEFLDDIGANNIEQFLQYTTGGEVGGSQGNFVGASEGSSDGNADTTAARRAPHQNTRLRGIGQPDYVRNYYKTNIPLDGYNTERVDINRGANSFLFGLGSPAGLINSSYSRAQMTNKSNVELQVDNEGSIRSSVNFNRELLEGKLAIRLAVLADRQEYRQRPAFRDDDRVFGAITYIPLKNTTVRAHFENGEIYGNAPDTLLPTQAFDTFIQQRTPIDVFYNIQHFGNSEGPNVATYAAMSSADKARFIEANRGGQNLLNNAAMWGYAMVYDGANGGDPSFGFQPQLSNNKYETNGNNPGDPFWDPAVLADGTPGGNADGAVYMEFWRNQRYRDEFGSGIGPAQGFTTLDGFDFSKQNFGGNTDYFSHDFNTYNISLEQLFLEGQVGFEIGYDKEEFDSDAVTNFNGWKGEFLIDINKTLPLPALNSDGSFKTDGNGNVVSEAMINPNFGRPFYVTEPNRSTAFEERETLRMTAFAKYSFADKHSDSFLKWFGNHTITALGDKFTERRLTANSSHQTFSDDFNLAWHVGNSEADRPGSGYRRTSKMVYMGPALQSYINDPFNPNTPINISDILINASTANLLDSNPYTPITYWSLGPDAEGSNWTHTNTPDPINNHQGVQATNDFGNEPASYTGDRREYWDRGTLNARWELGDNSVRKTIVESYAINLQSMFLENHLVANVGYREDVVENALNSIVPEKHDLALAGKLPDSYLGDRGYTIDPQFFAPEDGLLTKIDKGPTGEGSFGYGGVLHVPREFGFFKMPERVGLSLHYNYSKNFVPDASRNTFVTGPNHSFEALSSPIGEGKDIGFTVNLNENKLTARFNWFESSIQNNTADGLGNTLNSLAFWAIRGRGWAVEDIALNDPDGNRIIDVRADGSPHPRAGNARFDINRVYEVLDATEFAVTDGWIDGKLDAGLLEWNANGTQKRQEWFPGLQDTEDRVAKGFELNLTYNPTNNWRIALNATKIESVSSNVGPATEELMDKFFTSYNTIKGYTLWEAADTNGSSPFSNWFEPHVLNYFQKKLQEGSATNEVRKWSANFVTNYNFKEGRFRGFSVGGAVRWQSAGAIGYPLMDYEVSDGVFLNVPNVDQPWKGESALYADVNIGYRKRIMNNKVDWNARLHLKNVNNFGSDELSTIRANFDGTAASVRWNPPFQMQLVNSFGF